jgi:hypothetical protein
MLHDENADGESKKREMTKTMIKLPKNMGWVQCWLWQNKSYTAAGLGSA